MDNSIDIKTKLLKIQERPLKLPYQITPPEAAALIRERELLLKIAIALEEQNQYLIQKMETPNPLNEETVFHPIKKEDCGEELITKSKTGMRT